MRNFGIFTIVAVMTAVPAAMGQVADAANTTLRVSAEGRQALAEARGVAGLVTGLDGELRMAALQRAAEAYEGVTANHTGDRATCARASFEAGELWRRHGSLSVAERAYGRAAELDPGRYAERGLLQVAHMQRRQDQLEKANASYMKVAMINAGSSRSFEARLWIGRTTESLEKPVEAIAAYRQAVEAATRTRQSIEACNWLAKALVASGDLDGAAAALILADKGVEAAALKGESGVESLKKALAEMSARKALQRARDKKNGAHKDARSLMKGRRG